MTSPTAIPLQILSPKLMSLRGVIPAQEKDDSVQGHRQALTIAVAVVHPLKAKPAIWGHSIFLLHLGQLLEL
jgi:hypothetical protein